MILVYLGRWSYGRFQDDNNIFYMMKNDQTTRTWQDDIWCPITIILFCTSDGAKGTKRVPWHWDEVYQRAFEHVKATITIEVVVAYPDFFKAFEIYTDALSKQLGAVITQENWPIVFFSWKLSTMQHKYSVTKIELLAIVKTLKEFNGVLWGQSI